MTSKERALDRGTRRGRRILNELADELREARIQAGLSQAQLARTVGLSRAHVSRFERAAAGRLAITDASRVLSVLGRDLVVKVYPGGSPVRDAAQLALVERLRPRVSTSFTWRAEAPIAAAGDQRAFDVLLEAPGLRIGVEAETRLRDIQALQRRIELKQRDAGVDRVVLLVRYSLSNRLVLREADSALRASFPVRGRDVLRALRAGHDPRGNGLVML